MKKSTITCHVFHVWQINIHMWTFYVAYGHMCLCLFTCKAWFHMWTKNPHVKFSRLQMSHVDINFHMSLFTVHMWSFFFTCEQKISNLNFTSVHIVSCELAYPHVINFISHVNFFSHVFHMWTKHLYMWISHHHMWTCIFTCYKLYFTCEVCVSHVFHMWLFRKGLTSILELSDCACLVVCSYFKICSNFIKI